jgi:hypothetical protein
VVICFTITSVLPAVHWPSSALIASSVAFLAFCAFTAATMAGSLPSARSFAASVASSFCTVCADWPKALAAKARTTRSFRMKEG